jgi:hypothetical protein
VCDRFAALADNAGNYRIAPMPRRNAAETPSLAATWRRLNTQ